MPVNDAHQTRFNLRRKLPSSVTAPQNDRWSAFAESHDCEWLNMLVWQHRLQQADEGRNTILLISKRRVAMVLGLSLPAFTLVHVIISLIAIVSGLIVMFGLLGS